MKKEWYRMIASVFLFIIGFYPLYVNASQFKVLVVMSYDDVYDWEKEVKEGIDSVLANSCEIRYFYMDTKRNFEGGVQKAKSGYEVYLNFQPDGVITVDDNAQTMFVLPYLKDKVKTPVMFCGVNAEAEDYGFPASNVSGILERTHIRESISLAQQLVPSIRTVGYLMKESPSARAVLKTVQKESDTYPVKFIAFKLASTLQEVVKITEELKESCDLLFFETLHGIPDENGKLLTDSDIVPIIMKIFSKPVAGANLYHVKDGILCAVAKTGQEQGATASKMLLQAMQGTPVSQIPVTHNYQGKRVINVTVMQRLGIKPKPNVLIGADLVK